MHPRVHCQSIGGLDLHLQPIRLHICRNLWTFVSWLNGHVYQEAWLTDVLTSSLCAGSYLDSGRKVMDLFRARGWTAIITNNLVGYVLSYTTFTVGVLGGVIGIVSERLVTLHFGHEDGNDSFVFGSVPYPTAWAYM